MAEHEKSLVKRSNALTRFDPKARKELVVRALNALTEVKDADFYFFKGEEHRGQGQLKKAIGNYEKALQIDPEHEDSLFFIGICYMPSVKGRRDDDIDLDHPTRHKKAVTAFQKLIEIREKKDRIWWYYIMYYNLGLTQYNLGLYKEAIKNLEQAIELNPDDDADSYYMLGLSQENLEIYHLALENFETCLSLNSLETSSLTECIKYAKNRIEQLKGLLTDTYYYNMGIDYAEKEQYDKAIECYQKAINLDPEHLNSHCNLGCIKYRLGFYEEAIKILKHALKLDSEHAASHYNIGLCQEALGNYKSAIESYKKCLSVANPESVENQQFIRNAKKWIKELRERL